MNATLEQVTVTFVLKIYGAQDSNWAVCKYSTEDHRQITAVGNDLPQTKGMTVTLFGVWENVKGNKQFRVSFYEIPDQHDKESVVNYLTSLKCGIGKARARNIYAKFGESTWDVIINDPDKLLLVKGVKIESVKKLKSTMAFAVQAKYLQTLLSAAGVSISSKTIHDIIKSYGTKTQSMIEESPYNIMCFKGVTFEKADAVAKHLKYPMDNIERIKAVVISTLNESAMRGNTCMPLYDIKGSSGNVIVKGLVSMVVQKTHCSEARVLEALQIIYKKRIICTTNHVWVYDINRYLQEKAIEQHIVRLLAAKRGSITNIEPFISDYERDNFNLAEKQKEAIRQVFKEQVCIITGGPGVGKSTITKAVLEAHKSIFGESSEPVLLAPTGKAARRLSEVTGYPAMTIHSAIGYSNILEIEIKSFQAYSSTYTNSDKEFHLSDETEIHGNLFIIDEASMMDQLVAAALFSKIPTGAKVVIIGDPDQLPSVGCGNVLQDMISSSVIPTVKLDVIFRQQGNNPIVLNAHLINLGISDLHYTESFQFMESDNNNDLFWNAIKLYLHSVKKYGIDNVILLNPQRNNTDVSTSALNTKIQELLHNKPELLGYRAANSSTYSIKVGTITFKPGDKIMQLKNTESAKNGDTGYIRNIIRSITEDNPNEWTYIAQVEFNDSGEITEYTAEDLRDVDLAYCSTVHKSQGGEYSTVIIIVSQAHPAMLQRSIIYTGITRAKERVAILGEKKALDIAVRTIPVPRTTLLSQRLAMHTK